MGAHKSFGLLNASIIIKKKSCLFYNSNIFEQIHWNKLFSGMCIVWLWWWLFQQHRLCTSKNIGNISASGRNKIITFSIKFCLPSKFSELPSVRELNGFFPGVLNDLKTLSNWQFKTFHASLPADFCQFYCS